MLAQIRSVGVVGFEAQPVEVEVDVSNGLPNFTIVGLPDTAVKEARERVRAAIKNSGATFPVRRITVNLAPADQRKEGAAFDLPIAIGLLAATEQIPASSLENLAFIGELSLDGSVRPVPGVLPMSACLAEHDATEKIMLVLPEANAREASLARNILLSPCSSLADVLAALRGEQELTALPPGETGKLLAELANPPQLAEDMADVQGQAGAKRALEVAAAGGHNMLLIGPPGSGKTMLARRLPSILPPLSLEECLQVTKIYSIAGLLSKERPIILRRPFRAPHHTSSVVSIVGGGRLPRPGEITLANHGVLFLDELPEYDREVLESLRQPLEDRVITVSRISASVTYPANFILIGALNPCPCGFLGDLERQCRCTPQQIARYRARISGPLLDRIDLQLEVPRLQLKDIQDERPQESSAAIKARVSAARQRQAHRLAADGLMVNAQMSTGQLRRYCRLVPDTRRLLNQALQKLHLSMRAHDRCLKVARTIADLDGETNIQVHHMAEALQYRSLDFLQG